MFIAYVWLEFGYDVDSNFHTIEDTNNQQTNI